MTGPSCWLINKRECLLPIVRVNLRSGRGPKERCKRDPIPIALPELESSRGERYRRSIFRVIGGKAALGGQVKLGTTDIARVF